MSDPIICDPPPEQVNAGIQALYAYTLSTPTPTLAGQITAAYCAMIAWTPPQVAAEG